MLVSPVNSVAGQIELLKATQCDIFLTAEDFPSFKPVADAIAAQRKMKFVGVRSLQYWLDREEKVEIYPFKGTLEENSHRPFVVLHTSGSTGNFCYMCLLQKANQ